MSALPAWEFQCSSCATTLTITEQPLPPLDRWHTRDEADWIAAMPELAAAAARARGVHGWRVGDDPRSMAFCPACADEVKAGAAR